MNMIILITIIFTTALVLIPEGEGVINPLPCQPNYDKNAYNDFLHKHILQDTFNTASNSEWERYIRNMRLCDRAHQSFLKSSSQNSVVRICNGSGIRQSLNLCTGTSSMVVYDVRVDTVSCKVTKVLTKKKYVIVACDKVDNRCRPVHFQDSVEQAPGRGKRC